MKTNDPLDDIRKAIEAAEDAQAKKTYKYRDPVTNEVFEYDRQGIYKKNGRTLVPAN
jgi:hypothetical protein